MIYYRMYPDLYVHPTFLVSERIHWELPKTNFETIEAACAMAKTTHVGLREENWHVYKFQKKFFFTLKTRIPLALLYDLGFFKPEMKTDFIGSYYEWK